MQNSKPFKEENNKNFVTFTLYLNVFVIKCFL